MASDGKTFLDDKESFDALVRCLPPFLEAEYRGYGALTLEACFPSRKFAVYTLVNGRAEDIELITVGALRMSAEGGPTIEAFSDRHRDDLTLGVVPLKVPGREVFLQVPQKFELKWKGKKVPRAGKVEVHFAPHYAVLIRTRSRSHTRIDGHTYCVRLSEFWEMFPDKDLDVGY